MKRIIIIAVLIVSGYTCTYAQTPKSNKADSLLKEKYGVDTTKQQPGDTMYHPRKDSILPTKPGASKIKAQQGGAPEGVPRKPNNTGTKAEAVNEEKEYFDN